MERLNDIFTLDLRKMPAFDLVLIQREGKNFLSLKVLHGFSDVVISTIKKHSELIEKPRQINLFSTESLQDHFEDLWFYKGVEEISFVRAIENSLQALFNDTERAASFYQMKEESDEELLAQLCRNISAEDMVLSKPTEDELLLLKGILNEIREHYDIQRSDIMDLDDFIAESVEKYFTRYLSDVTGDELKRIAYKSKNAEAFKKHILSLIGTSLDTSSVIYEKDGYLAKCKGSIISPVIEISYLGACYLYRGAGASKVPYATLEYVLKEGNFWDEVWHELAGAYEKHLFDFKNEKLLKLKSRIRQLEQQYKIGLGKDDKNLRDGFNMGQATIAKKLDVSATTIAKDEKKALDIIKKYMHEKGLAFEDFQCA